MDQLLEAVHRHLAENGGKRALDVLGQQRQTRVGRGVLFYSRPKTIVSPNTDAVSASVSGVP